MYESPPPKPTYKYLLAQVPISTSTWYQQIQVPTSTSTNYYKYLLVQVPTSTSTN
jgi:hypothetical protein